MSKGCHAYVHVPWVELSKDDDVTWQPKASDVYIYTGSAGGGLAGCSSAIQHVVRNSKSLADLFLFIIPLAFFQTVAILTAKYCYQGCVVEKFAMEKRKQFQMALHK